MSEVATHGAKARLELCRDILKIRESLTPDASIARKHLAANRIGAIRRVLLGREGTDMLDRLLSPAFARAELEAMASDAKDNETPEKAATTLYVAAMTRGLNALASAEIRTGLAAERMENVTSYTQETMAIALQADAMIDSHIERGRIPEATKTQIPALKEAADKALSGNAEDLLRLNAPELFKRLQELDVESKRLSQVLEAHWLAVTTPNLSLPENERKAQREAAIEAYNNAQQAYLSHFDDPARREVRTQAQEVIKLAREALQAPLIEAAKAFTDSVIQASPVSAEQATAWADAQDITPPARARLKKIGYDLKQLRQDMAEFYRFSGGRVVKVKVHSKGDRRANATGIEDHGKEGVIHLDSAFDKRVLWHELAHHIEADPVAKMVAGKFIRRRSVDGKAYSLRSLTGNKGYRSNESAFKDHFFDAYVGKIYNHGTTEVFSMGVESFSDPLTLGRRMAQDPETLEFVAGYLKQPIHPLAQAHMELRGRLIDLNSDVKEGLGDVAEQLQKQLADLVTFKPDTDTSWTEGADISWETGSGRQVGVFPQTGHYVFETKVRNHDTGRKVTGFRVLTFTQSSERDYMDRIRWRASIRADYPTKDVGMVKVALAIFQKRGAMPAWFELNNVEVLRKTLQA